LSRPRGPYGAKIRCCGIADCRVTDFREIAGHYEVLIDERFPGVVVPSRQPVAPWAILQYRDNPTGGAVACWQFYEVLCFVRPEAGRPEASSATNQKVGCLPCRRAQDRDDHAAAAPSFARGSGAGSKPGPEPFVTGQKQVQLQGEVKEAAHIVLRCASLRRPRGLHSFRCA
jgi:hypothetical protein